MLLHEREQLRLFPLLWYVGDDVRHGGIWVRAGLHTNDQILSVNDVDITSPRALRNAVAPLQIGDTARVTVMRGGRRIVAVVPIAGYTRVEAVLEDLPGITPAQRARRERWAAGR